MLSVAAGAGEVASAWDSMQTMQDMKTNICKDSSVAIGSTKQLKDSRDGKYYWIAKLADGNCWMTQNLDFDVPSTLNGTTSNVNGEVSTNISKVASPSGWSGSDNNNSLARYYDPGDYYYKGPSNNHSQDTSNSCNNIADGFSNSKCNLFATTVANTNALGNTNAHYHVGNYYSWAAATVGSKLTTSGSNAIQSICPQGWQLPTSGTTTSGSNTILVNTSKSFAYLLESYGYTWNKGYYTDTVNGGTSYNIYANPFYFTYGGYLESSTLSRAGYSGYYWSSTVYSGTHAFGLSFNSNVGPANINARYNGFSVRCVAE